MSTEYTKTIGIGLVAGREFSEFEVAGRQHLALVNETFVRRFLSDGNPVGRTVRLPRLRTSPFNVAEDSFQVIGVVRDTLNASLTREVQPELFVPFTITGLADRLVIRTHGDPTMLVNAVRGQVHSVDRHQPVTDVRTMEAILEDWVFSGPRFSLILFALFAGLGLILGAVGVYGLMSYSVAQRAQEFGVRIALGAGFGDIAAMVVAKGFRLLAAGIVLGLAGSFASTRLLTGQLWNVSPFDPFSFAAASLVLLGVGLQACLWPAYRAARVDPLKCPALRIRSPGTPAPEPFAIVEVASRTVTSGLA